MKSGMRLLTLALLLAGCATETSSPIEKADRLTVPAVKQYTPAQMNQAADEMTINCRLIVPMLCVFVTDYGVMRDQARAALGIKVDTAR